MNRNTVPIVGFAFLIAGAFALASISSPRSASADRSTYTGSSSQQSPQESVQPASQQSAHPRNIIVFIADGLRHNSVNATDAPTMYQLAREGVSFVNSHALFPTFTTANASAIATGHYLGDTGDFSNVIYIGYPVAHANNTVTPFLEVNPVIADIDEHFGGDFLNEETILKMARGRGFSTAAIGKVGPTLIFDHIDFGKNTIVIDDATGGTNGVPIS